MDTILPLVTIITIFIETIFYVVGIIAFIKYIRRN